VDTASGGAGVTRTRHHLGPTPGTAVLQYDTERVPDRIDVYYRGRLIASTPGMVSGRGEISFPWQPVGNDHQVEVEVVGPFQGTRWRYRLGCPK
jgi:hypothetical protein